MPPTPTVYTVKEAAVLLSLTEGGVRKLIREGKWPTPLVKIGSRHRIPAAPLHRWLEGEQGVAS